MTDPNVFHNPDDLAAHLEKQGVPSAVARARYQAIQELHGPTAPGAGPLPEGARLAYGFAMIARDLE